MKYAIIGTGAIGGYYGAKLAYSGQDVHFLLHSDYQFVREHGLRVQSCDGELREAMQSRRRRAARRVGPDRALRDADVERGVFAA